MPDSVGGGSCRVTSPIVSISRGGGNERAGAPAIPERQRRRLATPQHLPTRCRQIVLLDVPQIVGVALVAVRFVRRPIRVAEVSRDRARPLGEHFRSPLHRHQPG